MRVKSNLLSTAAFLAILAATPALAAGDGPLAVSIGYAGKGGHPVIWDGTPNVVFLGTKPPFNAGAIKLHNQNPFAVKVVSVTVDLGDDLTGVNIWSVPLAALPSKGLLKPGAQLVLTQTAPFNFDTSDMGEAPCSKSGIRAVVHVTEKIGTAKPVTYSFLDANQVLCGATEGTPHWAKIESVSDSGH